MEIDITPTETYIWGLLVLCTLENVFKSVVFTCQTVLAQRFRMGRSLLLTASVV